MYQKNTFIVSLVLSGSIALAMPVQAAILEEIIVTAQKREQALSDVGIAVTAFTGEQIDSLGFESSTDIAALSPQYRHYANPRWAGGSIRFNY